MLTKHAVAVYSIDPQQAPRPFRQVAVFLTEGYRLGAEEIEALRVSTYTDLPA